METSKKQTRLWIGLPMLVLILFYSLLGVAGSLEPSGAPSPTMKTLDEVEPRTAIHASDLPLTINESGSYYFAEDIDFEPNDVHAITVECNDVTIDLMGYTLKGPDSGYKCGIYMNGRSNVEIRNGTIRDFGYMAIFESDQDQQRGRNHRVINIRALSNNLDGIFLYGYGHLVKDCTAAANVSRGIVANTRGTVTGNTCYDNGLHGIYAGDGSTISGNTCDNNGSYGIYAGESGNTVVGNTAINNTTYGIYATDYCLIDQNTAYNNGTNLATGTGCVLGTNCAP